MSRKGIPVNVERRLLAESMGRCMNPDCKEELFINNSDIIERAHIMPYYETEDNSFDNLIVLCPNCHKKFDKINTISENMVKEWKEIRKNELEKFFSEKFKSFNELKKVVVPILSENNSIYANYYIGEEKDLWNKFEDKILLNNEKLKRLFENNFDLFQRHQEKKYSNLEVIHQFITHVNEFKNTRIEEEKRRKVLFPEEINSIFGIKPINDSIMPLTESLEELMKVFRQKNLLEEVILGVDKPYILLKDGEKIFLNDTPRLRQLYFDYKCFKKPGVRLESLNFVLKYLRSRNIPFVYVNQDSLREININNTNIIFVYEYCLSKEFLTRITPKPNCIIVNLHNWNGKSCISKEALDLAELFEVKLLTTEEFYKYVKKIK